MKKSYFLMAAAAAMFAACAETDFVNEVAVAEGNAPQTIGFDGFAGKSTRAEIANVADLKDVGFKVWGYQGAQALWADGEVVTWGNSDWGYENTRYWDKNSDYLFGAVAPSSVYGSFSNAGEYTITDKDGNLLAITSGSIENATDYLTAAPVEVEHNTTVHGKEVEFSFSHIMSKVTLKLITSIENVKVTSVTMAGWNNNSATYADDVWTLNKDASAAPLAFVASETDVTAGTTGYTATSYLFVPQTNDLTFTVNYKIGDIEYNNQVAAVGAQEWSKNEHTVYTLTIGPAAILFGVDDKLAWDDVTDVKPE